MRSPRRNISKGPKFLEIWRRKQTGLVTVASPSWAESRQHFTAWCGQRIAGREGCQKQTFYCVLLKRKDVWKQHFAFRELSLIRETYKQAHAVHVFIALTGEIQRAMKGSVNKEWEVRGESIREPSLPSKKPAAWANSGSKAPTLLTRQGLSDLVGGLSCHTRHFLNSPREGGVKKMFGRLHVWGESRVKAK